jgi:mannose-1-phosphate guanylyltransferase/mannose-1-phosphate guanylyltransferase/mannose-6-phosphate isomerase
MKLTLEKNVQPFKYSNVERPWGYYGLYSDNEPCTSKILFIKSNELLSMQYHFERDQFYLCLDNNFIMEYSKEKVPESILEIKDDDIRSKKLEEFLEDNLISEAANEGDMFGFHRLVVHRAYYKGNREYGRILDVAFGNNNENDIIRIKDKYGR